MIKNWDFDLRQIWAFLFISILLTFNISFLSSIQTFLFIVYFAIALYAVYRNPPLYIITILIAVPLTDVFSYNELLYSQSVMVITAFYGVIRYHVFEKRVFLEPLVIIILLILMSLGKSTIIQYFGGFNLVAYLFLIPLFSQMPIKSKTIVSFAYIPLIFLPLYAIQFIDILKLGVGSYYGRLDGYVFQANGFAILMILNFLIILSKYLNENRKLDLMISIFYAVLIILTFSRMGLVSFALGLYILFSLHNTRFKINYKFILIAVPFLFISYLIVDSSYFQSTRFVNISDEDLQTNRVYIWRDIIFNMKNNFLFGKGFGGYSSIIDNIRYQRASHNAYLSSFVNLGIIGSIISYYYLIKVNIINYNFIKKNRFYLNKYDKIIAESSIASFFVLLLSSFTNSSAFKPYTSLIFYVLIAYIYKLRINKNY